jgi:hypothetical protein
MCTNEEPIKKHKTIKNKDGTTKVKDITLPGVRRGTAAAFTPRNEKEVEGRYNTINTRNISRNFDKCSEKTFDRHFTSKSWMVCRKSTSTNGIMSETEFFATTL